MANRFAWWWQAEINKRADTNGSVASDPEPSSSKDKLENGQESGGTTTHHSLLLQVDYSWLDFWSHVSVSVQIPENFQFLICVHHGGWVWSSGSLVCWLERIKFTWHLIFLATLGWSSYWLKSLIASLEISVILNFKSVTLNLVWLGEPSRNSFSQGALTTSVCLSALLRYEWVDEMSFCSLKVMKWVWALELVWGFQSFDKISFQSFHFAPWSWHFYVLIKEEKGLAFFLFSNSAEPKLNQCSPDKYLQALIDSTESLDEEKGVRMVALFDHEEVGSDSAQGAGSPVLVDALRRIAFHFGESSTMVDIMHWASF